MEPETRRDSQRVQSVERAFGVLQALMDSGGRATVGQLKTKTGLTGPTVHRILHTLIGLGMLHQQENKSYALGANLVPLGEAATRALGGDAAPRMQALAHELGESVNLAVLESHMVVYVAQAPSAQSMRMFTEVGRRVYIHSTAVGKAMLATMPADEVKELIGSTGMPPMTPKTLTTREALIEQLPTISRQGYALDNEEQELGVRCLAVPVPDGPTKMALSVSGPTTRVDDVFVRQAVPLMTRAAVELSKKLRPRQS